MSVLICEQGAELVFASSNVSKSLCYQVPKSRMTHIHGEDHAMFTFAFIKQTPKAISGVVPVPSRSSSRLGTFCCMLHVALLFRAQVTHVLVRTSE